MEVSCDMKVFISYAHTDTSLARKVTNALEKTGLDVWSAEREILPGDNWAKKIAEALEESDAMVVLLTQDALRSKVVQQEIGYALGEERFSGRLVPVLVGSPERLNDDGVPWILRRLKTVNLPEHGPDEEGMQQIAQALKEAA